MVFHGNWQKSRAFFIALARAHDIFHTMPIVDRLPYISFWQPEAYYKGLLCIKDLGKMQQLMILAEQPKDVEKEVLALMDDPGPEPQPSADPRVDQAIRQAHNFSVHVLLGGEGGLVNAQDVARKISVRVDGHPDVEVHFDRCSHSSGMQRGYIRCLRCGPPSSGGHPACFRYAQVRKTGGVMYVYLYLSMYLSIYVSIYLSIFLSIYLFIYLSIY